MWFSADQIIAHLVGDYIFQSHWMAQNKTKSHWAAIVHAVTYQWAFIFITHSFWSLFFIYATHFLIDRYRLARYVVWLKNWPIKTIQKNDGPWFGWKPITATGYPEGTPDWLAVWLLIFADNTLHLLCNGIIIHIFG